MALILELAHNLYLNLILFIIIYKFQEEIIDLLNIIIILQKVRFS